MAELSTENLAQGQTTTEQTSEFASLLLQEFKPKTERAREAVETAVRTLAEHALEQTSLISNDAIKSIESIIAALDAKLTAQVNLIMHHADFQQLESAWRGLHYLVNNTETDEQLKRFLARLPYGAKTDPVEEFAFEEETDGADSSKYAWANSAYAMAVNINRSFKLYGWCSRIRGVESGGEVQGLPAHTFPTDDGGVDMKCPTEIAISDRREAELAKNGFMPLLHKKNTDFAAFIGAQSLQKPAEYDDPDATANANLAARLPYLFASCRFAHYLKCIVRDKIGSFKEKDEMQRWLQDWILNYVDGDPAHSTETTKAQHPLAAAEVVVEEVEGNPGYYNSKFFLRPHYQLEGLTVSLRLVSKLPSAKEA